MEKNIQEFHDWIGDNNRFDVTAYNISTCFWPWWSSADLWPFEAKNIDFSFLLFEAGRNYIFEEDRYEYKYIESVKRLNENMYNIITCKTYDYFYETRDKIKIRREIFIEKRVK